MDIVGALIYKYSGKEFTIVGTSYSGLNWLDSSPKPTQAELQAAFQEYKALGIDPYKQENWQGLQDDLRGSALFAKAISTSNTNGFSLLLSTVAVSHNVQDLEFALGLVRSGLAEDYTAQEIAEINALLVKHAIKLVIE